MVPTSARLDGRFFYQDMFAMIDAGKSLGYKPPAPEVFIPVFAARAALQPRPATPPALADRPTMN
jgi:hypothetical protein